MRIAFLPLPPFSSRSFMYLPLKQDLLTGDEIISDTSKIIDAGNGLWEVDGRMMKKGQDNFGTNNLLESVEDHSLTAQKFLRAPTHLPRAKMPRRAVRRVPPSQFLISPINSDMRKWRVSQRRSTRPISRVCSMRNNPKKRRPNLLNRVHEGLG